MEFRELTREFARIEKITSRNEMTVLLAELLRRAESKEVRQVVYLALGRLRPKYDRLEFSLAEKMVIRAIARAVGTTVLEVTRVYKREGDLGEVIQKMQKRQNRRRGTGALVGEVYAKLVEIAKDGGRGSQERKIEGLAELLRELEGESAKYVVRIVMAKLRLGFSDKTVLDALSYLEYGNKEGRTQLDRAYQVFPDVGVIAEKVKERGVKEAEKAVKVSLGTPVVPALAQRLKTADEMVAKMGKVIVEPKFDGTRVEIHFSRKRKEKREDQGVQNGLFAQVKSRAWVRTFTRNLDENSWMFPELARMGKQIAAAEVILDSEAVGYDPKTGKMLPFQMTITRKRKHGVGEASRAVPLKFYVFDILYRDGESLLARPLRERRKILAETVRKGKGPLVLDEYLVTDKPQVIREYHEKELRRGLEGVMVKRVKGKYLPGRQGWNWVKFKESENARAKLADTLDVVVMGYYKGRGKRVKFGMGAFLAGVRKGDEIVTIAKIGTGLTDVQFAELFKKMQKLKKKNKRLEYRVAKGLVPDVWVEPEIVVEVAADEVTRSPAHTSGVALRFPRLVKFREDKDLAGVTTLQEVKEIAGRE